MFAHDGSVFRLCTTGVLYGEKPDTVATPRFASIFCVLEDCSDDGNGINLFPFKANEDRAVHADIRAGEHRTRLGVFGTKILQLFLQLLIVFGPTETDRERNKRSADSLNSVFSPPTQKKGRQTRIEKESNGSPLLCRLPPPQQAQKIAAGGASLQTPQRAESPPSYTDSPDASHMLQALHAASNRSAYPIHPRKNHIYPVPHHKNYTNTHKPSASAIYSFSPPAGPSLKKPAGHPQTVHPIPHAPTVQADIATGISSSIPPLTLVVTACFKYRARFARFSNTSGGTCRRFTAPSAFFSAIDVDVCYQTCNYSPLHNTHKHTPLRYVHGKSSRHQRSTGVSTNETTTPLYRR